VAALRRPLHARGTRGRGRGLRAADAARAHGGLVRALAAGVRRALPDRLAQALAPPAADAPRPGEPRGGAVVGGHRLAAGADRRPGGVGRRRAHGGALRAARGRAAKRGRPRPLADRRGDGAAARVSLPLDRAGTPLGDLLLRGARVLDPRAGLDQQTDLLVREGEIAEIGDSLNAPDGAEVVDAEGLHAFPAFVDPHVHLRTPGREDEEDIDSGTRAAAAGGFCAILAMPNTDPVVDSAPVLRSLRQRARE